MTSRHIYILPILLFVALLFGASSASAADNTTTRAERNYVREGNKAYADSNYMKAIELYNRALETRPNDDVIKYNIARAYLMESRRMLDGEITQEKAELHDSIQAMSNMIFTNLYHTSPDKSIRERSALALGNNAFLSEDYEQSIDMYKNALRLNPDNERARHNLRVAQLKMQQGGGGGGGEDNKDQDEQQQSDSKQQPAKPEQGEEQQAQNQPAQPQQVKEEKVELDKNAENLLNAVQQAENRTKQDFEKQQQRQAGSRNLAKPW